MSPLTIGENDAADHLTFEPSCKDEMRLGQKNKLTSRMSRKGSRPRAAHDQRTQSAYLFGGVCPERGAGAALVLPACNCEAMQLHLDEIATKVALGAYAIILLDQAGCMAPRPWWFRTTSHSCRCRRASALYHMYAERIEAFRHNPPATDWNGVYEAESK